MSSVPPLVIATRKRWVTSTQCTGGGGSLSTYGARIPENTTPTLRSLLREKLYSCPLSPS